LSVRIIRATRADGTRAVGGGRRRREVATILPGRHAQHALEGPVHRLHPREAGRPGHLGHALTRALEEPPRDLHALRLDKGGGSHADLAAKDPGEVPRAHPGPARQRLDGAVAVGVIGDPALHLAHAVALGELGGELHAELRLAAGPPHEHHQPARHLEGALAAVVLLHQLQGEVHPGRHTGRLCYRRFHRR